VNAATSLTIHFCSAHFSVMSNLIADLKRDWRLTKLIRSTELTGGEALQLEKVDRIYIEECRQLRSDLIKTSEALCRDIEKARKSLTYGAGTVRKSLSRKFDASNKTPGQQSTDLENSLSSSSLKISQLLDASQKTLSSRLGQVEQSSQNTMELVDNVREFVATKAHETRRWQEGYDWRIHKNYLTRVVSTLDDIETKLEKYCEEDKQQELLKDIDFLRETLEIHLEEEGVRSFAPLAATGVDPLKVDPKGGVECTVESQVDGTIAEVIKKRYAIDQGEGMEIVRRA
jgi:molecular chaperone GrpE (heat shock protein)